MTLLILTCFEHIYNVYEEIDSSKRLCKHVRLSAPDCMTTKCIKVNGNQFERQCHK